MYSLYIKTKLKLSARMLIQIGILRCLFILILLVVAWWNLLPVPPQVSVLLYAFLLASYHGMCRDKEFLKITFPRPTLLYIAKYLFIAVLFLPINFRQLLNSRK